MKMNKSAGAWLVLLMSLFGTLNAQAAIHYVRQGASGSGNGNDWASAYASLPNTLVRGDTYYIAAGSYPGKTFNTPASGNAIITIKKATESDHGANTGWQSSYGSGQAIFNSQLSFQSSNWLLDGQTGGGAGNWSTGFGFKVKETGDANAVIKVGNSGSEPRYNNITIRHIDIQGKGASGSAGGSASNDGVAIYGGSSFTLSYAWFHGIGRCPVFGYSQGVLLFEHIYVSDYNYFGSNGVHSEVASLGQNSVDDFTWRYSLVTDIKSTGGLMWNSKNNKNAHMYVYGNIFYKPAGAKWEKANGVVGGWTSASTAEFRNVSVYNNTFINVDQDSLSGLPQAYSNNVAYNNIFYNSQSPNFAKFATHDYNHFINSGGTHSEANGSSTTSEDPFSNASGLDFRLKAATPAGKSFSSPYDSDPSGTVRGSDKTWDRGAFEFGGNTSGGTNNSTLLSPTNLRVN